MIDIDPTTLQQLPVEWLVLRLIEFAVVRAWKWLRDNPWHLCINKEEKKVEVSFAASTAGAAAAAAATAKASVAEPEDATKQLPAAPARKPTAKPMKKTEKKQPSKKAGLQRRRHSSHD